MTTRSAFRFVIRLVLLINVILFALSTVTAPIIASLAFLKATFQDSVTLYLGTFGGCVSVDNRLSCPRTQFGYSLSLKDFPDRVTSGPDPIDAKLTFVLTLFPCAGILVMLSLFFHAISSRRIASLLALWISILAFVVAIVATGVAIYIFNTAIDRINTQFSGSPAQFGNAMYLVIVALALQLFACIAMACTRTRKIKLEDEQLPIAIHRDVPPYDHSVSFEKDPAMFAMDSNNGEPMDPFGEKGQELDTAMGFNGVHHVIGKAHGSPSAPMDNDFVVQFEPQLVQPNTNPHDELVYEYPNTIHYGNQPPNWR